MRRDNLVGMRFGRLVVIDRTTRRGRNGKSSTYWICKCDCGNCKEIISSSLKNGETRSCGCLRRDSLFHDLTGKRFNRLLVLSLASIGPHATKWRCRCDCGAVKEIRANSLVGGKTKSCGCMIYEPRRRKNQEEIERSTFKKYLRTLKSARYSSYRRFLLPIEITENDLKAQWEKQRGICPYTGWKMRLRTRNGCTGPDQASVDRIDSSKGYLKNNIQFVSLMANYAKNSFDDDYLFYFCRAVAGQHPSIKTRIASEVETKAVDDLVSLLARYDPAREGMS